MARLFWLLMVACSAAEAQVPAPAATAPVEVPFRKSLKAADLSVERFTAELTGENVKFVLAYTSGRERYLSFFNPPNGTLIKYIDRSAVKVGQGTVTFTIPLEKLRAADAITVRISMPQAEREDANFLSLNLGDPSVRPFFGEQAATRAREKAGMDGARSGPVNAVADFADIRWKDAAGIAALAPEVIRTLTFNERTRWNSAAAGTSREILQRAMNPGLGVRSLHQAGITGKGVSVGIVDQHLLPDHPEFKDRIAGYHDVGCNAAGGSMHAPAVASLLAGQNIGTAPGARVYFAAAPSWTKDAKFQALALHWLLDTNEKLPPAEKIRVISVSAAPSGAGSPFTQCNEQWDAACERAEKAGVLVLDCTAHRGIIGPCYYDLDAPDDLARVKPGYPGLDYRMRSGRILAPASPRTTAEEYAAGECSYQYNGRGGLSWTIPYVAGVLALGWEVNPRLSAERMVALLRATAYDRDGLNIINPVAFVEAVKRE